MDKEDEEKFVSYVLSQNDYFINTSNQSIDSYELIESKELSFFIASSQSKINLSRSGFVDSITSDVIQYSRGIKKESQITHGRLWFEVKYYDESQVLISKEKWLKEKFRLHSNWIKENYRQSRCKDFYIGEGAYQHFKNGNLHMMATPILKVEFE